MRDVTGIRTTLAGFVALGFFDLYDVSAQIGHEFRGIGRAYHVAALDDANAVKRA
jgi:hypothetical protein